jgi:hypothetical protein
VTFTIGAVSSHISDRILTAFSLILTLLGCTQLFFGAYPRQVTRLTEAAPYRLSTVILPLQVQCCAI